MCLCHFGIESWLFIRNALFKTSNCVVDFGANTLHVLDSSSNLIKNDLNTFVGSFSVLNVDINYYNDYLVSENEIESAFINRNDISSDVKDKDLALLLDFRFLFSEKPTPVNFEPQHIVLKDYELPYVKPYLISYSMRETFRIIIEPWSEWGLIQECSSPLHI